MTAAQRVEELHRIYRMIWLNAVAVASIQDPAKAQESVDELHHRLAAKREPEYLVRAYFGERFAGEMSKNPAKRDVYTRAAAACFAAQALIFETTYPN